MECGFQINKNYPIINTTCEIPYEKDAGNNPIREEELCNIKQGSN